MAQVSHQQRTRVCNRWIRPRQSIRLDYRCYYQDGKLYYAARFGTDLSRILAKKCSQRLKGLKIDACPFANLPERKRTQWALSDLNWLRRSSSPSGRRMVT